MHSLSNQFPPPLNLAHLAKQRLVEGLREAVFVMDAEGCLQDCNPAAEERLIQKSTSGLGKTLWPQLSPIGKWPDLALIPARVPLEFCIDSEKGVWLEAEAIEIEPEAVGPSPRVVLVRDVSTRKEDELSRLQLERRVLESEKSASLGLFAAGVSHDFNNLITGILGSISVLEERLKSSPDDAKLVQGALQSARGLSRLVEQIYDYTGHIFLDSQPQDLGELVSTLTSEFRRQNPEAYELDLRVSTTLPQVSVDQLHVANVVNTLLLNASEALPQTGGRIEVQVRHYLTEDELPDTLVWQLPAPEGGFVSIEVEDNGCGMDETVLARAFEPFFSTKFVGRGLGLAAAWGIARAHGAGIGVCSSPGVGTRILVAFPLGGQ